MNETVLIKSELTFFSIRVVDHSALRKEAQLKILPVHIRRKHVIVSASSVTSFKPLLMSSQRVETMPGCTERYCYLGYRTDVPQTARPERGIRGNRSRTAGYQPEHRRHIDRRRYEGVTDEQSLDTGKSITALPTAWTAFVGINFKNKLLIRVNLINLERGCEAHFPVWCLKVVLPL